MVHFIPHIGIKVVRDTDWSAGATKAAWLPVKLKVQSQ